jgi:hypothetical protein
VNVADDAPIWGTGFTTPHGFETGDFDGDAKSPVDFQIIQLSLREFSSLSQKHQQKYYNEWGYSNRKKSPWTDNAIPC